MTDAYSDTFRHMQETEREEKKRRERNYGRAYEIWRKAKETAKRQPKLPFKITRTDIVALLDQAEKINKCPILGIGFEWEPNGRVDGSLSLDRIVPHKGYVTGNVAIISWRANKLKSDATLEELQAIVAYVQDHVVKAKRSKRTGRAA